MFLGIDPSLRSSGVVLLDERAELIKSWNIKTKEMPGALPARLVTIRHCFSDVYAYIHENNVELDTVAIETPFIGHNKLTAHILSAVWGSISCQVYQWMPKDFLEVHPSLVKRFATHKPMADKADMADATLKRWGFRNFCDDIVDAYVLAHIGRCHARPDLTEYDEKQKQYVRDFLRLKRAATGAEDT